eukprot:SAG31_NODE_9140_length_1328_cov_1.030919_2_plen_189_part_00
MPELTPPRFEHTDPAAIKAHLKEHGFAVVANAATAAELEHARELLWTDLEKKFGWQRSKPETWTDEAYDVGGDPRSGLINMVHSDTFWYCRTLPGVLAGFAAAYGTDDLVTAYDRMAVNRPLECGETSIAELWAETQQNPLMRVRSLHTHYNQDGFGDEVLSMPMHTAQSATEYRDSADELSLHFACR